MRYPLRDVQQGGEPLTNIRELRAWSYFQKVITRRSSSQSGCNPASLSHPEAASLAMNTQNGTNPIHPFFTSSDQGFQATRRRLTSSLQSGAASGPGIVHVRLVGRHTAESAAWLLMPPLSTPNTFVSCRPAWSEYERLAIQVQTPVSTGGKPMCALIVASSRQT